MQWDIHEKGESGEADDICRSQMKPPRPKEKAKAFRKHRGEKKAQKDAQIIADSHQGISKSVILKHFP